MNKREQITLIIEDYIQNYCPKDKHTLKAGGIRKWPAIDKLCENLDIENICNDVDAVTIKKEITNTTKATTTHEITF